MHYIIDDDNIRLAYRNLKNNSGSKTPGTDGKTIRDISEKKFDEYITYSFSISTRSFTTTVIF